MTEPRVFYSLTEIIGMQPEQLDTLIADARNRQPEHQPIVLTYFGKPVALLRALPDDIEQLVMEELMREFEEREGV